MWGVTAGNFKAVSGPLVRRFFLPTLVGIGGSYFFFLSFSSFLSPPPGPDWFWPYKKLIQSISQQKETVYYAVIVELGWNYLFFKEKVDFILTILMKLV